MTINIADRFLKGTTLNMCDFVDFKIERVLMGKKIISQKDWSPMFTIDSLGNFSILDFSKPISNYLVFVTPYNGN